MDVANDVVELKEKYREYWRNKSQWYWAWRLCQEVAELIGALLHIHRDSVDWELMQISAIGMNWLEMREAASLSNKACRRQVLESPKNKKRSSRRARSNYCMETDAGQVPLNKQNLNERKPASGETK